MVRRLTLCAVGAVLLSCGSGGIPSSNPVEGLVTSVSDNDLEVSTEHGERYTFRNEDDGVPVVHLREHQRERLPVTVTWERDGDELVARIIGDAP